MVPISIDTLQQLRRFKMAITNYKFVKANSPINPSLQHIQRYIDGVLESNTVIPQDPHNTDTKNTWPGWLKATQQKPLTK
mgnify:CR=1 FL=1